MSHQTFTVKPVEVMEEKDTIKVQGSRQVTALARKALSFQKRQMFTNICCIGLCPLIMVALAAFLGSLITSLLQSANPIDEFVYCSNVPAMNEVNVPEWSRSKGNIPLLDSNGIPGTTLGKVYHPNWALVRGVLSTNGPPGAAAQSFRRPCVYWYGEDYPRSALYEREPNATGNFVRDSSTMAQPKGGWFGLIASGNLALFDATTLNTFIGRQQNSWTMVSADPSVDLSLIGQKPRLPTIQPQVLFRSQPGPEFIPSANGTGLLGTIPTKYYLDIEIGRSSIFSGVKVNGLNPVPSYNISSLDEFGLDNFIADNLKQVIADIAKVDKNGLLSRNANESAAVFLEVSKYFKNLPHGALYFKKIDHSNKKYSWNYHIGSDARLESASNFPMPGPRLLFQQTQLDNAILRNSNISRFSSAKITQGLRILPQVGSSKLELPFGSLIGSILYPFGISFLLPIFVIVLVQEKENRILVMMRMNGMKTWSYYISHYITMLILFLVSTAVFYLTGLFSKLTLFTVSDKAALCILLFVWGNNQISLAFFFSTLFNKSRTALVIVFLIVLCSVIVSLVIEQLFLLKEAPWALFLWPPFAFYRALGLANRSSFDSTRLPLRNADLIKNTEVARALWFMVGSIFVVFLLAAYFDAIFPTEFGIKKPWYFPITGFFDLFRKKTTEEYIGTTVTDDAETQFEDDDVREERKRVVDPNFDERGYPLVMKNMRKVYAGRGGAKPKLAVKDVTFAVEKGITFGLLGPNGAGKSTLISILTGLYEATSGSATLAGCNIKTDTANVYKSIGICPQFDILWDELTVGEHLYFYARLKGVVPQDERRAVKLALEQVSLTALEDRLTKGLSGGEKRRLSIAIALIGNPIVIFLDEPTTGLDPEVRRLHKTVILTTHSMEEAEALCQRIGIMARGTLRCIANPLRLKELYGTGYKVFANSEEENTPQIAKYLETILPSGWRSIDSYATQISYEFPSTKGAISKLFEEIQSKKTELGIMDWGLGQTTLEEVFIRLISEADAAAEY